MASKRPADALDEISTKRFKPRAPRLNYDSRMAFIYFYKHAKKLSEQDTQMEDYMLLKSLLISPNFINSFFIGSNSTYMPELFIEKIYLMGLRCEWKSLKFNFSRLNAKFIAILIQLSSLIQIRIHVETYASASFRPIHLKKWNQICKALKDSKTLESIDFRMKSLPCPTNRLIFDLIPDKIANLRVDSDLKSIYSRDRKPLNALRIMECRPNMAISLIFKTRTKYIEFVRAPWNADSGKDGLLTLGECGRLAQNLTIEEVRINIQFIKIRAPMLFSFGFTSDVDSVFYASTTPGDASDENKTSWQNIYLPKYKKALKCLKMVNPDLKLELVDQNNANKDAFESYPEVISHLAKFFENVKLFVDMANEIGTKIKCIQLNNNLKIKDDVWSQKRSNKLARHFRLELDKRLNIMSGVEIYKNVRIEIKQTLLKKIDSMWTYWYYTNSTDTHSSDSE